MPAAQAMPIKESHTPVLDVLNQKGFDVIPSAIIKNTTIDYIGVSKNQLFYAWLIKKPATGWRMKKSSMMKSRYGFRKAATAFLRYERLMWPEIF